MRTRSWQEKVSGEHGSLILTPAAYAAGSIPEFWGFRPVTGASVSALKAKKDAAETGADEVDVLTEHITGGAATTLDSSQLITCRRDMFTSITVVGQNIEIFL